MVETRIQLLRRWKDVTAKVASAVGKLYPDAELYLVGGAARGLLTVLSDIDIAIVFDRAMDSGERTSIVARVWEELERIGVPTYYPLHLLVLSRDELEKLGGERKKLSIKKDTSTRTNTNTETNQHR